MKKLRQSTDDPTEERTRVNASLPPELEAAAQPGADVKRSSSTGKRRRLFSFRTGATIEAYIFLLPSLIGLLVFTLLPVIAVAVLSLFDWGLLSQPSFIGLHNYDKLIHSPVALNSLLVTMYYVLLNIPSQTILALLLALLMNKKLPGIGIFRVLIVIPWMATPVAMGIIWQWIFDPQYGALNLFLAIFGIHGATWLSSQQLAMPSVAAVNVWGGTGYSMLFFLAGLQSIPDSLYEAARTDGANAVQRFFKITLPLLNPAMLFVLVTNIISSFQIFDTVYTMTRGGPGGSTNVFTYYIYQQAFNYFHAGYASALSMVLFSILLIVTVLQMLYFRKRTVYDLT